MSAAEPPAGTEGDIHIAGVLVHVHPNHLADTLPRIDACAEAEVRQATEDGRAVVLLEAASAARIVDCLDRIRALRGVLNVALVYQHAEAAASMQQEMPT